MKLFPSYVSYRSKIVKLLGDDRLIVITKTTYGLFGEKKEFVGYLGRDYKYYHSVTEVIKKCIFKGDILAREAELTWMSVDLHRTV